MDVFLLTKMANLGNIGDREKIAREQLQDAEKRAAAFKDFKLEITATPAVHKLARAEAQRLRRRK